MNWTEADVRYMSHALQLAENGCFTSHPNPRVGCVFVRDNHILAEGWHVKSGEQHAEINAIESAKTALTGACCYVTLEPCQHTAKTPPCTKALLAAGISSVVIAMDDPNPLVAGKGIETLKQAGIKVKVGLLREQAQQLNKGFISRMVRHRPFITCKLAISLDGKIALGSGLSKWITGCAARKDVQRLRACSAAIMTGINTVLVDDPRLNVREIETNNRQPIRIVMDRKCRLPKEAQLLKLPGQTLVFAQSDKAESISALEEAGVVVELLQCNSDEFLAESMQVLAKKYDVNEILVEAGPTLSGALLQAKLIDELIIYQSPCLLGDAAVDMINLATLTDMKNRTNLQLLDEASFGDDRRFTFTIRK